MRNLYQGFEVGVPTKLRHKFGVWHQKSSQSAMSGIASAWAGCAGSEEPIVFRTMSSLICLYVHDLQSQSIISL